jgi:hypothetical protein
MVVDTSEVPLAHNVFYNGIKDKGMDSLLFYLLSRRVLYPFAAKRDEIIIRIDRRKRPPTLYTRAIKKRLKEYLSNRGLTTTKLYLRSIEGKQHPIIYITDLLLGATMARWNKRTKSKMKLSLIEHIESTLGYPLNKQSRPTEHPKFNIWLFKPK